MKPLIIRADASPEIGTGHVMRCLALAEAWQDSGGEVIFLSAGKLTGIENYLKIKGIPVLNNHMCPGTQDDAEETLRVAHEYGADWIVADGYHFCAEYQKTIKDSGLSFLVIDDYGNADHYYADIVLNQNIYADLSLYPRHESYTRFLLGSTFVLLRREFRIQKKASRVISGAAKKILVTLGGGDPHNITLVIIQALEHIIGDTAEVIVVVGGANPHYDHLQQHLSNRSKFSLVCNVSNMPDLMTWADMAISAGGSTCWELIYMRLPFLAIIMSDNQRPIVTKLEERGMTISLGYYKDLQQPVLLQKIKDCIESESQREILYRNQDSIITGQGCNEVIKFLK